MWVLLLATLEDDPRGVDLIITLFKWVVRTKVFEIDVLESMVVPKLVELVSESLDFRLVESLLARLVGTKRWCSTVRQQSTKPVLHITVHTMADPQ